MHSDHPISRRDFIGFASAVATGALLPSCIPDGTLKRPFQMRPVKRPDGMPIAAPGDVGLDTRSVEAAYRRAFDESELPNIRSLLVARHGILVAEAYIVDPADIGRRSALMSATKSVTSTLAGIALDRGELTSLDVTVGELFPGKTRDEEKNTIRLNDTLTMRAGIDFSNDDFSLEMEYGSSQDSVADILGKPLSSAPGTQFNYTDASAHLAGAMVQRATGATLDAYARKHLFPSAGITGFDWLHHRDGLAYGAYGLFLTPRDFLRFGGSVLRAARAEAGAPVSSEWMAAATSFQVKPNSGGDFDYGFLWWLTTDGSAFTANGHGGQFAYSVPELDLEIVVTADPNSNEDKVSVSGDVVHELASLIATGAS